MKNYKIYNKPISSALPITREELIAYGITPEQIEAGEARGEMSTKGPWNIPISYTALCMSTVYDKNPPYGFIRIESTTVYGTRTMSNIRQSGYDLEGYVSIKGKKYSAFTSSQLFELPDGKLINVATIHARVR
jgi:hypothetical protein